MSEKRIGPPGMRSSIAVRLLLILLLVLFNSVAPGIFSRVGEASGKSGPSTLTTAGNPKPDESRLRGPTAGQAYLLATVDVSRLPQLQGSAASASDPAFSGQRARDGASIPARNRLSPLVTSPSSLGPSSVALLTGFEGLNQAQGAGDPPDVSVAAGPSHVFEMVNNVGEIFSKQGTLIKNLGLASFFQIGGGTSDPKVLYDASSQRWFASIMDLRFNRVVLAVSASNDPTGIWNIYSVSPGVSRCTDQPLIGVSDDKFVVSGNVFSITCPLTISSTGFLGAQYWILNKLEMVAGLKSVDFVSFGPDPTTESVYPSQSLSSTTSVYMVSAGLNASFDSGAPSSTSNAIQLLTITGVPPGTVTVGSRAFATSISRPPGASQPGTTTLLQTDDARVQDAVWFQGSLWLSLNDACTPPGDNQARSCIHLIQLDTALFRTKQDFEFGNNGQYFFFPALSIDNVGDLGVIYGYSSATSYPSLAVTGQGVSDPPNSLAPPSTIRQGNAIDSSGRYGDYFGVARDPSDPTIIWEAGEYSATTGRATFIESMRLVTLIISASPTYLSISPGSSASSTLTLTSVGGFAATVSLTASISPSGPTVSINPSSVTLSSAGTAISTFSVSTTTTTPTGPYNVTLTATSSGGSRTFSLAVRVGPDFAISTSLTNISFRAGSSGTTLATITSLNNFAGSVSLSASIWAPGPTTTLNQTNISLTPGSSGSSKLTAAASLSTAGGNYAITLNGTSGSITHVQIITVGVTDFGISSAPTALTIEAGSSAVSNVTLTSINGLAALVKLTAGGPAGPSPSLNPTTVSLPAGGLANSTLTISIPGSLAAGSAYNITVTGTNGTLRHWTTVTVKVSGFTMSSNPNAFSFPAGASGASTTSTITLTSVNGYARTVALSASVSPTGPSVSLNSTSITLAAGGSAASKVTVSTTSSTLAGIYTVNVTGTSSAQFHTAYVYAAVTPFTVNINNITTFTGVTVKTSGTLSIDSPSSTITLSGVASVLATNSTTGATLFSKTYIISGLQFHGSPSSTFSFFFLLNVAVNPYRLSSNLIVTFSGTSTSYSVSVSRNMDINQNGIVDLPDANAIPPAYGCTIGQTCYNPQADIDASGKVDIFDAALLAYFYGSLDFIPNFSISSNPSFLTIPLGSSATSAITLKSLNGFAGTVNLAASTTPGGPTLSIGSTTTLTVNGTTTSTLTVGAAPVGTYTINVTATSGILFHYTLLTVNVVDFSISSSRTEIDIAPGQTGSSTITLTSLNGFAGTVSLSVSISPSGPSPSLTPTSVTLASGGSGSSLLRITTTSKTTQQDYTVTVVATSGSLTHSVVITLVVFANICNPNC